MDQCGDSALALKTQSGQMTFPPFTILGTGRTGLKYPIHLLLLFRWMRLFKS